MVLHSASPRIYAKSHLEFAGCCAIAISAACFVNASGPTLCRTNASTSRQQQACRNSRGEAIDSRAGFQLTASFIDAAAGECNADFDSGQRAHSYQARRRFVCGFQRFQNACRVICCTSSGNLAHSRSSTDELARRPGYTRCAAKPGDARDFFASAQHDSRHGSRHREGSSEPIRHRRNGNRFLAEPVLQRRSSPGRQEMGLHSCKNFRSAGAQRMARAI